MIGVESGGAIIGIVDIAVRVGLRLARFLHDVNEAEEARSTLYTRVAELDRIVNSVRTIVQTRDQDTQKPISDDEYAIRLTLLRAISRCEGTVQRFEQQIAQLGNIERRSRWWRSVALQIRLDVHENTLARTDKDIQADIAALQLLYMCFLPFKQEQRLTTLHTHSEQTNIYLSELRQEIGRQSFALKKLSSGSSPPQSPHERIVSSDRPYTVDDLGIQHSAQDDGPDTQIVEESLDRARSFIEAISTRGSVVGQERGGGTIQRGSSLGESGEETDGKDGTVPPEADDHDEGLAAEFGGRLPQDVMIKFLDKYMFQAGEDLCARRFRAARFNLLEATEWGDELEKLYKWPFEGRVDVGVRLSEAYTGLRQFDEAEKSLRSLLPLAGRHPWKNGQVHYFIARVHRARYEKSKNMTDLDRLDRSAKVSYHLAWASDMVEKPFLAETAEIMFQLYVWKQDFVAAETIRELHPIQPVSPNAICDRSGNLSRGPANVQDDTPETRSSSEASSPNAERILLPTESPRCTGSLGSPPTSIGSVSSRFGVPATIFAQAQAGNDSEVARMIADGEDVEQTDDKRGLTPLLVAAKYKRTKVCEVLLNNDVSPANVQAQDIEGQTALHLALSGNGGEHLVPLLLRSKAKLNAQDKLGRTPLHVCAEHGNQGGARALFQHKAKWEIVDMARQTALCIAIKKRNQPIVEDFLRYGAVIGEEDIPPTSEDIKWIIAEQRRRRSQANVQPVVSRKVSASSTFSNQTTNTANSTSTKWERVKSKFVS